MGLGGGECDCRSLMDYPSPATESHFKLVCGHGDPTPSTSSVSLHTIDDLVEHSLYLASRDTPILRVPLPC